TEAREVRGRERRDPLPRRDRRHAAFAAGEAPARPAGTRDRARRRPAPPPDRRPGARGDARAAAGTDLPERIPRGSVLPPAGRRDPAASSAGTAGRHSEARAAFPGTLRGPRPTPGST